MDLRIFTEPQQGATYDDLLAVAAERRGARLRRVLPLRPLPRRWAATACPARPTPGSRSPGSPARPAAIRLGTLVTLGDLPAARAAGDHGRPGRPDERRPGRAGPRRGLVRAGARRVRHPVPAARRAVRPARGAARRHHRPVGDARRARPSTHDGPHYPVARLAGAAQAGPGRRRADHRRRRRQAAHAHRSPPATPPSSTPASSRRRTPAGCSTRCDAACARGRPRPRDAGATPPPRWSASAATTPTLRRRAEAIGRDVDELGENGLAGTPSEAVDKLGRLAEVGATRVYLQVLDLADLDHLADVHEALAGTS